jgi:hypothetical protein
VFETAGPGNSVTLHLDISKQLGDPTSGRPRYTPLTFINQSYSSVDVTAEKIEAAVLVDDFDQHSTGHDLLAVKKQELINALNRKIDKQIIAALNQTSNVMSALPTANKLDLAAMSRFRRKFSSLNSYQSGMNWVAMDPAAGETIRTDIRYVNGFKSPDGVIVDGEVGSLQGLMTFETNFLPNGAGGGDTRRVFGWHKNAVVLFVPKNLTVIAERQPLYNSWQITASLYSAAVIRDPAGVIAADITVDEI